MNYTDDWLESLRKKQAERRESQGKPDGIKAFFRRNAKRCAVAGLFVFILFWLATSPGIGGNATVHIASSQTIFDGHPCPGAPVPPCRHRTSSCLCVVGIEHKGVANFTFNPWFYPINHPSGTEVSAPFTRLDAGGRASDWESLKKGLIIEALFSEFPINIPLFYAVGFALTVGLEKVVIETFMQQRNRSR